MTRLVSRGSRLLLAAALTALLAPSGCDPPDTRTADGAPDGRKIYTLYCEACHGPDGSKPAGAVTLARAAAKPAAALRSVVEQGRGRMPPWKNVLHPDQISAVVDYLKAHSAQRMMSAQHTTRH
jgi:mono/diheme cytochrome c family protein